MARLRGFDVPDVFTAPEGEADSADPVAADDGPPDRGDDAPDGDTGDGEKATATSLSLVDGKFAIAGGAFTAAAIFGMLFVLGSVGTWEARALLESSLPSVRFLASTAGTASATILALMLTLISLSHSTDVQLRHVHYARVRLISWLASIALLISIALLVVLVVPLGEADRVPTAWLDRMYYAVVAFSATLGGVMFSLVVMLLYAVLGLIGVVDNRVDDARLQADEA
ncbi:MAG: hypothetical protein ACOC83_06255 [Gemmatimonadota bacterium]